MKKVALVFVIAVFVPSLVLAWLAVRSLRDQEFLLQRQQSLLYQTVADSIASGVQNELADYQHAFTTKVAGMLRDRDPVTIGRSFDQDLRKDWPLAQVGFAVNLSGSMLCPSPTDRPETLTFCANYSTFLSCRESAEVYWNTKQVILANEAAAENFAGNRGNQIPTTPQSSSYDSDNSGKFNIKMKSPAMRNVNPQQQAVNQERNQVQEQAQFLSKFAASETEFCQLMGAASDGMLARFVNNKLNLLFWYRPPEVSTLVFGAQISLPRLVEALKPSLTKDEPELGRDICLALLDDTAKPVSLSHPGFQGAWKRPFVATEIGESLPHWEVAVYLLNPAKLTQAAQSLKLTLGLVIGLLVLAIGVGSWLIVSDLNRQLTLARQKTDFVSNVSHELKTPLTSIRMFSELIAEGRVTDPAKQRSYLGIITSETARLTRLINNVLDFARIERGEKKYEFKTCDIVDVVRETAETYRPHLESNGFHFDCELPATPIPVKGDRDALAQVVVNLVSNAEKYSNHSKEITVRVESQQRPLPHLDIAVMDRGLGVPKGAEEKIFEQFYRAHDSLNSGIQGSGLGLTLARQIARAHGGDVIYESRAGGGSCFIFRLPLNPEQKA